MIPIVIGTVLFLAGLAVAAQGVIGKEISSEGAVYGMTDDPDHPGMRHPPERHRGRLVLAGLGFMVAGIGIIWAFT